MNIAEQMASLEVTREAKKKRMTEVLQKSVDESRSTSPEEAQEFDTLKADLKTLDGDLVRMRELERITAVEAKPVQVTKDQPANSILSTLQLKKPVKKLEPGIAFARYARCKGLSFLDHEPAREIAKSLYPDDEGLHRMLTKAAVPAANTLDATWAANLVAEESGAVADFVEFLRPQTILGKFGMGNIPSLRRVPFRTPIIGQTSGGDAYWTGEGKAKPLTSFAFTRTTIEPLKVANIAVATMELLRDSSPSAAMLIRDSLAAAIRERVDLDFIDPNKAAVTNVSPASILQAQTPIPSSGSDAEDIRADFRALFSAFLAANNPPSSGVWIMPATTAMAISLLQNPLGQTEFPEFGMGGGLLFGMPAIVSDYALRSTEGAIVALVNASDIYLADEGGIEIKVSDQASLEMDNAPTNSAAPAGAVAETTLVSLWQTNCVGFLAEWTINWALRRVDSVQYLEGVTWGEAS